MSHSHFDAGAADFLDSAGRRVAPSADALAAFHRFFANSKIVDPTSGRPLLMLHGTRPGNDIESFHIREDGHEGAYFTPDPSYAAAYTCNLSHEDSGITGPVYAVYLSIKNPFVVTADDDSDAWEHFVYRGHNRAELIKQGYDGAVLRHKPTGEIDQVVAFYPQQIKSAVGNPGTYNADSPHITDGHELQLGIQIGITAAIAAGDIDDDAPRQRMRP
jgi:hypothetical protein